MKNYFHGSPDKIDGPLWKHANVSSEKCNALRFALRRGVGKADCYIYRLLLSPDDVKQVVDGVGVVDHVLTRQMPYVERILVTNELIENCRRRLERMGLI
jgi:hypothetical protein